MEILHWKSYTVTLTYFFTVKVCNLYNSGKVRARTIMFGKNVQILIEYNDMFKLHFSRSALNVDNHRHHWNSPPLKLIAFSYTSPIGTEHF